MIIQLVRFLLLVALAFLANVSLSRAQESPPTADAQGEAASAPAPPADDAEFEAVERNPAIRAALEMPRENPGDYLQAILWLIDLGRTDLAAPILEELRAQELADDQRAELVTRFGSAGMLKLARTKDLAPGGAEFATAAMNAVAAEMRNPETLARLVAQLADPQAEVRTAARADLVAAGQPGVNATLEGLARESDPARRRAIMVAAARMQPLVGGPLLAMLDTADPALQADVRQLLAHLGVAQAAPFLPADTSTAERILTRELANLRAGAVPFAPDEDDKITLWHWNDETKRLTPSRHSIADARTIWMARLAAQLARVRPERYNERQALIYDLEARALLNLGAADEGPRSAPAATRFDPAAFDSPSLESALAASLERNLPRAATTLIAEMGNRRDGSFLYSADGKAAPLAAALSHPNRRVRFAAVRAIMAIDPRTPYPGASHFAEALAYFATSAGQRRAVVAAPTAARATDLAASLAQLGIEGTATNQGTEAVQLARLASDLELVLVDMDIHSPDVRQVVYELRIFPTTGEVPIALLAPDGRLADAQRIAEEHAHVIAAPRLHSAETTSDLVERLLALGGPDAVSPDERAAQGLEAITWLRSLLDRDDDFYALRRFEPAIEASLYRPGTTAQAIEALGGLATADSQVALVDYASQTTLPLESRRAAAAAFERSVEQNGLLLTTREILLQYDRYNASATADADTQQLLGALLDVIERSRAQASAPGLGEPHPSPPR